MRRAVEKSFCLIEGFIKRVTAQEQNCIILQLHEGSLLCVRMRRDSKYIYNAFYRTLKSSRLV
jgi:hypothetical protein